MPNFRGTRFSNAHETLIWCTKSPEARYTFHYDAMKALNEGIQMRSDWTLPLCTGRERLKKETGEKLHSTQKPEALLYRVVMATTDPGDVILIPFWYRDNGLLRGDWDVSSLELTRIYLLSGSRGPYCCRGIISPEDMSVTPSKRSEPKVPFGAVVERGLQAPGAVRRMQQAVLPQRCVPTARLFPLMPGGLFIRSRPLYRGPQPAMGGHFGTRGTTGNWCHRRVSSESSRRDRFSNSVGAFPFDEKTVSQC